MNAMLTTNESSTISMFMLLLSVLREQQTRFAHHPNMIAILERMRAMMVSVLDLLDDEELDELIRKFPPEMDLLYPTTPFLAIRDAA